MKHFKFLTKNFDINNEFFNNQFCYTKRMIFEYLAIAILTNQDYSYIIENEKINKIKTDEMFYVDGIRFKKENLKNIKIISNNDNEFSLIMLVEDIIDENKLDEFLKAVDKYLNLENVSSSQCYPLSLAIEEYLLKNHKTFKYFYSCFCAEKEKQEKYYSYTKSCIEIIVKDYDKHFIEQYLLHNSFRLPVLKQEELDLLKTRVPYNNVVFLFELQHEYQYFSKPCYLMMTNIFKSENISLKNICICLDLILNHHPNFIIKNKTIREKYLRYLSLTIQYAKYINYKNLFIKEDFYDYLYKPKEISYYIAQALATIFPKTKYLKYIFETALYFKTQNKQTIFNTIIEEINTENKDYDKIKKEYKKFLLSNL